jgi:hypothetical protein
MGLVENARVAVRTIAFVGRSAPERTSPMATKSVPKALRYRDASAI